MEEERKVGRIKIDEGKFNAVKGALRNGLSREYIINTFGISSGSVYNIKSSETYDDYLKRTRWALQGEHKSKAKKTIDEFKFEQVKSYAASGKPVKHILALCDISNSVYYRIKQCETYEEYQEKFQGAHRVDREADGTQKPKIDENKFALIKSLKENGVEVTKIEELLDISNTTIYDVIKLNTYEEYRELIKKRAEEAKAKREAERKEVEAIKAEVESHKEIKPDSTESYLQQIVDLLKEINDKLGKEEQPEPEKKRGWFSKAPF